MRHPGSSRANRHTGNLGCALRGAVQASPPPSTPHSTVINVPVGYFHAFYRIEKINTVHIFPQYRKNSLSSMFSHKGFLTLRPNKKSKQKQNVVNTTHHPPFTLPENPLFFPETFRFSGHFPHHQPATTKSFLYNSLIRQIFIFYVSASTIFAIKHSGGFGE